MFRLIAATTMLFGFATVQARAETVHVYGPGGPAPAMKEAIAAFNAAHPGTTVEMTAGPTPAWIEKAKADGDVIYSGSEVMMTDFATALGDKMDASTVVPLYLRSTSILVRPGNPNGIKGIADLLKPGHRILVVNGAGQQGLWEDVAGRLGKIESVRAFRSNIVSFAANSAAARDTWTKDSSIDAWLIWGIWQVANPSLADQVTVESEYNIFRDTGVALTKAGAQKPEAKAFAAYLATPDAGRIFSKWGWTVPTAP